MSDCMINLLKNAFHCDEELKLVMNYCKEGWPDKKFFKNYYKLQNDLHLLGDLLLNNKIIVPKLLKAETLALIHEAHMGIEKCKNREREIMYWPGLQKILKEF